MASFILFSISSKLSNLEQSVVVIIALPPLSSLMIIELSLASLHVFTKRAATGSSLRQGNSLVVSFPVIGERARTPKTPTKGHGRSSSKSPDELHRSGSKSPSHNHGLKLQKSKSSEKFQRKVSQSPGERRDVTISAPELTSPSGTSFTSQPIFVAPSNLDFVARPPSPGNTVVSSSNLTMKLSSPVSPSFPAISHKHKDTRPPARPMRIIISDKN